MRERNTGPATPERRASCEAPDTLATPLDDRRSGRTLQNRAMNDKDRQRTGNKHEREANSRPLPDNMGRDPLAHGDPRSGPDVGVAKNTGPGEGGGTKPKSGGSAGEQRG
jgi:hypothetical protein